MCRRAFPLLFINKKTLPCGAAVHGAYSSRGAKLRRCPSPTYHAGIPGLRCAHVPLTTPLILHLTCLASDGPCVLGAPTTSAPTDRPTKHPTIHPTKIPTWQPTIHPAKNPTSSPTTDRCQSFLCSKDCGGTCGWSYHDDGCRTINGWNVFATSVTTRDALLEAQPNACEFLSAKSTAFPARLPAGLDSAHRLWEWGCPMSLYFTRINR